MRLPSHLRLVLKSQNGGLRGEMVTNGPHQCVRQPQKREGVVQKI